jgi:hypothetical protein
MRLRTPRKQLFGNRKKKQKRRKYVKQAPEDSREPAWYENIYYSTNASFKNTNNVIHQKGTPGTKEEEFSREMSISSGLSGSFKFMGWLVSEPSVQLSEKFAASNKYLTEERYRRNDNLSAKLRLGTTLYGTFMPNIGSVTGLRHVMTPSISYSYGKRRAYYAEDPDAFLRFDKNDLDKGRVNSMSINLLNIFQMKTVQEEKENKIDLFRLRFATSVDFEKEERKVSPLSTTFDFTPLQKYFTTRLTASHDFYHDDDSFHLFSPYMRNVSITTTLGLSDTNLSYMGKSSSEYGNSNLGRDDFSLDDRFAMDEDISDDSDSSIPFNMNLSHTYQIQRSTRTGPGKYKYRTTHNIKPTFSLSPTKNLSLNYYLYYDIVEKSLNFHRLTINRDLHCWEANVSWIPSGVNEGFYFLVNIKDLPDVKIEKRRGSTHQSY